MKKTVAPAPHLAPPLRAIPFLKGTSTTPTPLLTDEQREALTSIGTRLRLPSRMVIYREDSPAEWIFAVAEGAVKSYRELPSGKRDMAAFLFGNDLFGLAENGRYVNTAQAICRVVLYRLPIDALTNLLQHDSNLQFKFLAKVTHELREAQRRTILVNRRDAVGRLAMFLVLMRDEMHHADKNARDIPLPMNRSDIADFLGLSLESVSRASAELERRGIVKFQNRHLARVLEPARLGKLAAAV
jgi:CRP-like cAMP-binding protein